MKELLNILHRAKALTCEGRKYALATVVKIGGSTYRRPGARMLVTAEGDRWGTLSGGCLEGEVAQQALQVIESGIPQLIPFDLAEDDIVLGFGTGCNGIVHVLIQPLLPGESNSIIDALIYATSIRKTAILATIITTSVELVAETGNHLLLLEDGSIGPSTISSSLVPFALKSGQGHLEQELQNAQIYLWHTETFETQTGSFQILFEVIRPPINLLIFGEGHDVQAVIDQALIMGWTIELIGRKPVEILANRFPSATSHKFLMHPENVLDWITPDNRCAALVMNHTYVRDRDVMEKLLNSDIPYIGMLGPRERTLKMLTEIDKKNTAISSTHLEKLFGPVGLDIGTETPEEIALSAVAEIQSVLHHRQGSSLRERQSPIHHSRTPIERS